MVFVRFTASLNGTVSHKYDNDEEIDAISEDDLNTELGSSGGFAVLSVGKLNVWKVVYLPLRDGCQPLIAVLRKLRDDLPQQIAIAAIAHNIDRDIYFVVRIEKYKKKLRNKKKALHLHAYLLIVFFVIKKYRVPGDHPPPASLSRPFMKKMKFSSHGSFCFALYYKI
eukprot:GEMP01118531.1.p1 GENE.GEMP01118531.1~~GEMP01118531.1.p1  ORF type:complete len:168 (+),score=18.78 GEMP01118531.1:66-569(+)